MCLLRATAYFISIYLVCFYGFVSTKSVNVTTRGLEASNSSVLISEYPTNVNNDKINLPQILKLRVKRQGDKKDEKGSEGGDKKDTSKQFAALTSLSARKLFLLYTKTIFNIFVGRSAQTDTAQPFLKIFADNVWSWIHPDFHKMEGD